MSDFTDLSNAKAVSIVEESTVFKPIDLPSKRNFFLLGTTLGSLLTSFATLFTLTTALTAAGLITPARTLAFSFQDDPNSTWGPGNALTQTETGPNNNTRLIQGFEAESFGGATRSLGFVIPYLWARLANGDRVQMSFRNDLGGWFTDNYDNTSLLVTLANFPQRVPVGTIANITGNQSLPLTSNCDSLVNPSCVPRDPSIFPVQTLNPTDELPVLDLGIFSPVDIESFDVAVQYDFGDNRPGAPLVSFNGYTIIATSEPSVPEPTSVLGLLAVGTLGAASTLKGMKL